MRTIAAFAGVGVAALLCLAGPARAQEGIFMKELLGSLGVIPEDKPRIEYRERAPLVLPPKASLPAPIAKPAEAAPASRPSRSCARTSITATRCGCTRTSCAASA